MIHWWTCVTPLIELTVLCLVFTDIHLHGWRRWRTEEENRWVQFPQAEVTRHSHFDMHIVWTQPSNPLKNLWLAKGSRVGMRACAESPDLLDNGHFSSDRHMWSITWALTKYLLSCPHRKPCYQHQLLCCPQPPGSVLQDGCWVWQVHRVWKEVSIAWLRSRCKYLF